MGAKYPFYAALFDLYSGIQLAESPWLSGLTALAKATICLLAVCYLGCLFVFGGRVNFTSALVLQSDALH